MNKIKFSAANLKKISLPASRRVIYYDENVKYLAAIASKNGIAFYYIRKISGKTHFAKIGDFPAMTPADAQQIASGISARVSAGLTIFDDANLQEKNLTLNSAIQCYLNARLQRRGSSRSLDISRRRFELHLPKSIAEMEIKNIKRGQLQNLLYDVGKNIGHRTANLLLIDIKAAINYVIKNEFYSGHNPASGVERFEDVQRSRYLQRDEMHRFFSELQKSESENFIDVVTLLIFTGKRLANVVGMRWEWIDFEENKLVIPRQNTKTHIEDVTALTDLAMQVLRRRFDAQKAAHCRSPFVFPSDKTAAGHETAPKKSWESLVNRAGVPDLRIHDLRRTLASWMAERGTSLYTIASALGHSGTGATPIYARLSINSKRAAIDSAVSDIAHYARIEVDTTRIKIESLQKRLEKHPEIIDRVIKFVESIESEMN